MRITNSSGKATYSTCAALDNQRHVSQQVCRLETLHSLYQPAACSQVPSLSACLSTQAGAHRLGRIVGVLLLRQGSKQQLTQLEHRLRDCEVAQFRWWAWASGYGRCKVCTFSHYAMSALYMHCYPHLQHWQPLHLSVVQFPCPVCSLHALFIHPSSPVALPAVASFSCAVSRLRHFSQGMVSVCQQPLMCWPHIVSASSRQVALSWLCDWLQC